MTKPINIIDALDECIFPMDIRIVHGYDKPIRVHVNMPVSYWSSEFSHSIPFVEAIRKALCEWFGVDERKSPDGRSFHAYYKFLKDCTPAPTKIGYDKRSKHSKISAININVPDKGCFDRLALNFMTTRALVKG